MSNEHTDERAVLTRKLDEVMAHVPYGSSAGKLLRKLRARLLAADKAGGAQEVQK